MIGTLLGNRYELLEKIGEGGMATVYKAKCHLLNRFVAVKILKEEFNNDSEFVEKFKSEARNAASLSHINIVNIYDVGSENNINYIVMEYVNGQTLKEIIKQNYRLSAERTVDIAIQIASALQCAHKNNLIHRDIKPHNILVTSDGLIKVTDFGIAKVSSSVTITNSSKVIGSAHYFSPEQAKGSYVDCKTDIYSLGIVMYEMITGKVPYDAESPVSVALKHIQEQVVPPIVLIPDMPMSLNNVILKAVEKEPIKRYQTAGELLVDLNKIKNNKNVVIESPKFDDDRTRVMNAVVVPPDTDEDEEISDKPPMSKKKKVAIFSSIFIVLAIISLLLGYFFAYKTSPSPTPSASQTSGNVTMPTIIGKSKEDAQKTIEALGLKFTVGGTEKSDNPEGTVIKCNINSGDSVPKGSEVRVIVSGGQDTLAYVDVRNYPLDHAKDIIINSGFTVGTITPDYSDTVPVNNVISQDPDPDSNPQVTKGQKINLVISKGPKDTRIAVPDVRNLKLQDAKAILIGKGFTIGVEKPQPTQNKALDGLVLVTAPGPGEPVKPGTPISITYYQYVNE